MPLALAFIVTLGRVGLAHGVPAMDVRLDFYGDGFKIYSKLGLDIIYLYFQLPLMILIMAPAIDGLKKEWLEAAQNLGATACSTGAMWRCRCYCPRFSGTMVLLFGNAFGA